MVGALGRRHLLRGGVVVVYHGGDAVAHGALVAPARRDQGGGVRLWERPPSRAVDARAHCGIVSVSLPVGPFLGPEKAPPGHSTEQNPRFEGENCSP